MARKLIVEVLLDSAAYTRQMKKATATTTAFSKNLEKAGRGAAAGSGAFRSMGRSVAFASGGFLAFASGTEFLRESVDAAREAAVSQRSLAAQMKAAGESFTANKDLVDKAARSYSRFGFQNDEVIASLTVLERATGSINKSIALQALTADIARAKSIDLAAAAAVVGKVFGGQETALRRAVPGLAKHAHGMDLIRLAQAKMAGQAAANTTATERFGAALHDFEEVIGGAMLPALDTLLTKSSLWLSDEQNQKNLTKDLTGLTDGLASSVEGLAAAYGAAKKASSGFDPLGFANIRGGHGLIPFNKKDIVGSLTGRKGILYDQIVKTFGFLAPGGFQDDPRVRKPHSGVGFRDVDLAGPAAAAAAEERKRTAAERAALEARKQRRNQWFDAMVGRRELRAGLLSGASAQLAAYKAVGAILTAQIAAVHDVTRKENLKDEALRNAATVAGLTAQIHADLIQKQQDAAQKLKEQIEAARQEKLGWLDFAIERAGATKTIKDNLAADRAKEKFLQGLIKREGRTLEYVSELWRVRQDIKDLNKKNVDTDPLAGLFQVSTKQLTNILAAGTGLGAGGRRQLGFNIAGAEIQPVHVHLNMDGREVASVVTKQQARAGNRTAKQTSGRRG